MIKGNVISSCDRRDNTHLSHDDLRKCLHGKTQRVSEELVELSEKPFGKLLYEILEFMLRLLAAMERRPELTITDVWRDNPRSVHGDWRGVDVRATSMPLVMVAILHMAVNTHYKYDPTRENYTVSVLEYKHDRDLPVWIRCLPGVKKNPNATNVHIHLQVHPRTVKGK